MRGGGGGGGVSGRVSAEAALCPTVKTSPPPAEHIGIELSIPVHTPLFTPPPSSRLLVPPTNRSSARRAPPWPRLLSSRRTLTPNP